METTARNPFPSNPPSAAKPEGMLNMASSSAHAAVESVAGLADEAARKAKPAIDGVAALAHQAVDKVAGAAAPSAEWLADQAGSLKTAQKKLMQDSCSYISANPLTSIAIALVAGFVISRVIR